MRSFLAMLALAVLSSPAFAAEPVEESNLDDNLTVESTAPAAPATQRTAAANPAAREARDRQVADDLTTARALKARLGSETAFNARMAPMLKENRAAARAKAARWDGDAYYAAGNVGASSSFGNFFEGILSLRDYLATAGVDLIVVRVPNRNEVAFPHFVSGNPEPGLLDYRYLELKIKLLEAGVEYLDGLEIMHRRGDEYPISYWYMMPNEGHPAEGLSRLLASVIAERLKRYELPETDKYELVETDQLFRQQKYPAGNPKFDPEKTITAAGVVDAAGKVPLLREENRSPILFTSDSYAAYPGRRGGATIPHYVMHLTRHQPDWLYRDGSSGGTPTFLYRKGRDFLRGRQAVVAVCHPGNLFGTYAVVPPVDLQSLTPDQFTVLKTYNADNWAELPAQPTVGTHPKAFTIQPDGTLLLFPVKENAVNGNAGTVSLTLTPEMRRAYQAFAVRLTLTRHAYATITAEAGATPHYEYLTVTERVKELTLPVKADKDQLTLTLNNISGGGNQGALLAKLELLGLKLR